MSKRNLIKYPIVSIFLFSVSAFAQKTYETKSLSNWNYVCDVNWTGGVNHNATSHTVHQFSDRGKITLHHVSKFPIKALRNYPFTPLGDAKSSNDELRIEFERRFLKFEKIFFYQETGSYFMRLSSLSPDNFLSYRRCEASFLDDKSLSTIECKMNDSLFSFSVENNRFVYSQLGSWHTNSKKNVSENEYGSSSYFSYGSCDKSYD